MSLKILAPAFLVLCCSLWAGEYTTIDCPGATYTSAASINTAGQIVGSCTVAGITQGFLRQPNGDFQTFTADNSATSNGVDINESGVVVGMYLTDLVMIQDGNGDFLKKSNHLINFYKRVKTAEVIREIQQYQSVPYCLTTVPEIQTFIRRGLDGTKSVVDLYDMSLALEPR